MLANFFTDAVSDLTDSLEAWSESWWFLIVIFVIALLDSVIPIVPSETAVIVGGVAAGQGDHWLLLVIAAGAVGAFSGDNIAYTIGDSFRIPVERFVDRKEERRQRLAAAARQIHKRGGMLLITARFIPGGRTAMTVSSGITQQPRRWFVSWVALAALIWATYAATLGYVFGQAFEDDHTLALWLAFAAAVSITGLIELIRWVRERRR